MELKVLPVKNINFFFYETIKIVISQTYTNKTIIESNLFMIFFQIDVIFKSNRNIKK